VPPEQIFFRRLAVFVGGFTLDAAEKVAGSPSDPDTLELLSSLVEQSLLRPLAGAGGEPRFSFLETVREYASHCLASSGEEVALRRAHAEHYFAFAERAATELTGPAQTVWLDRLEVEHDNLRATLAWTIAHDPSKALRLVAALWRFWWVRGHLREGRSWAEAALALSGGSPGERAMALHVAGDLAQEQGDYAHAKPLLTAGRDEALTAGDSVTAALCLNGLGFIARNQGAFAEAAIHHEEALALQRPLGDRRATACTLGNLGSLAQKRGDAESAEALFAEALATFRALDHHELAAGVASNLAILANQIGDHERARRLATEALETYDALGDRQACAIALVAAANAERALGEPARASVTYEEALALFRAVDHQPGIAVVLNHLADMRLTEGDPEAARPLLAESLRILQRTGELAAMISALEAVVRVATTGGQWREVARLSGALASVRDEAARVREDERDSIATAMAALGELAYTAAEAAGRALGQEETIVAALRVVEPG
jgi:tetratricopeptide (TPR) repeat protein